MLVWIVRHGKAERAAASGRDEDRALASRGERQADWLGSEIRARDDRPGVIVSSPVLRAITTAKRVNAALGVPLKEDAGLVVGVPVSAAVAVIEAYNADEPLMLVGHNPQLEYLVGSLVEGLGSAAEMKTGQAVLLEIDGGSPIGSGRVIANLRLNED